MSLEHVTAFTRPATLADAYRQVLDGGIPISGGTDVILRRRPLGTSLVDLTGLPLDAIDVSDDRVVIGATATLTDVLRHETLRAMAGGVIADMLRQVGSPLLRNVATIGGHVARGRLSDVIPVLLALDASISFYDGGDRTEGLEAFYAADRHRDRVIVTGISIPIPGTGTAAAFRKFSRTGFDLAILNAACRVDVADGIVAGARIIVGETPALGARVPAAEQSLVGGPIDARAIDATVTTAAGAIPAGDDQRASAAYRRALAGVLVRRCLDAIAEDLR